MNNSDVIKSTEIINANDIPENDPSAIVLDGDTRDRKEETPPDVNAIPNVKKLLDTFYDFLQFKDLPENKELAAMHYGNALNLMYEKYEDIIPFKMINVFMDPDMTAKEQKMHMDIFLHMVLKLDGVKKGDLDIEDETFKFTDKMYDEGGIYSAMGGKERYMRIQRGEEKLSVNKDSSNKSKGRRRHRGKTYIKKKN